MRRMLLQYLLPLAMPFVVYGVWMTYARYRARLAGTAEQGWRDAPVTWLLIAGLVLVVAGFMALAFLGGAPIESVYVPPHMVDGEIVPGRFE